MRTAYIEKSFDDKWQCDVFEGGKRISGIEGSYEDMDVYAYEMGAKIILDERNIDRSDK